MPQHSCICPSTIRTLVAFKKLKNPSCVTVEYLTLSQLIESASLTYIWENDSLRGEPFWTARAYGFLENSSPTCWNSQCVLYWYFISVASPVVGQIFIFIYINTKVNFIGNAEELSARTNLNQLNFNLDYHGIYEISTVSYFFIENLWELFLQSWVRRIPKNAKPSCAFTSSFPRTRTTASSNVSGGVFSCIACHILVYLSLTG